MKQLKAIIDRNVDAFKLDVIMGFGEFGKVAFVHKNYDIGILEELDPKNKVEQTSKSFCWKCME